MVRKRMEEQPELLRHGLDAVLYAVMALVVDGYFPVLDGVTALATIAESTIVANTSPPPRSSVRVPARSRAKPDSPPPPLDTSSMGSSHRSATVFTAFHTRLEPV